MPQALTGDSVLGYGQLENGIAYLVAHEIAHSLPQMQLYDQTLWNDYLETAEEGLTEDELRANYYESPQFAKNEARANSIARAIAAMIGKSPMIPDPRHGYED